MGVAVLIKQDRRVLLGRRRGGGWCIPCGHVEWEESIECAAIREMAEETGLDVTLDGILAVKSNFHDSEQHTVGIWFRGRRRDGLLRPNSDLVDAAFFALDELPELCFPTDAEVLRELDDAP